MSTAPERLTAWLNAAEELAKSSTVNRDEFHVACVGGMTGPMVRAALSLDDVAEVLAELATARHMLGEAIESMDAEGMDTEFWTSRS